MIFDTAVEMMPATIRRMREPNRDRSVPVARALPAACLALAAACLAMQCPAGIVRTKADMRLWQTVADRTAPLEWPWADAADSATLVFSNRVDGAVARTAVRRGEGETRGGCEHPFSLSSRPAEALVDITLEQSGAGTVLERESATLAYVAGAGGGPVAVRAKQSADWRIVREARVVAYDPAWRGLEGESGYFVQMPVSPHFTIRIR